MNKLEFLKDLPISIPERVFKNISTEFTLSYLKGEYYTHPLLEGIKDAIRIGSIKL